MKTDQLAKVVEQLKFDLHKRVQQFNKETGLEISGVIIEGIYTDAPVADQSPILKTYRVGVNIEL